MHIFCLVTCFLRRPILALDWHLPARCRPDYILVEVPSQSVYTRLTYFIRSGRTSVDDGDEQQVPSLSTSATYVRQNSLARLRYQRTRDKERGRTVGLGLKGVAIASRHSRCAVVHTCHKRKLSIFHNTTMTGLVRPNVAVCVAVQLDGSV